VTYGANARANVRWKAGLSVRNGTRNEANDTTGLITAVELSHFETQLMIFLQQLAEQDLQVPVRLLHSGYMGGAKFIFTLRKLILHVSVPSSCLCVLLI
jgi:hypothetical protein